MGFVLNSLLFLLKRGPELFETGKLLSRSLAGPSALTDGGTGSIADGGGRLGAIEQELRDLNEARERLSADVGRLSHEVLALGLEVGRVRKSLRLLLILFSAFVATGLILGAVILSRFP